MSLQTRRPSYKFNEEVEDYIRHQLPHGIYETKSTALRKMFDGMRKRTIIGVLDVASRAAEMVSGASVVLLQNSGAKNSLNPQMEKLPANARITKAWYEVATTFTSAADTATLGFGIETDDANGTVAPAAINAGGNPWDAGSPVDSIQDGTTAAFSEKTTDERDFVCNIGVQDLTAGLLYFYIEYVELPG